MRDTARPPAAKDPVHVTSLTSRRILTALLAAGGVAFAGAPAAQAAPLKLKLGVYDCMRYDYASGFLMFSSTVKLKSGNRYEHAFGRKGSKLTDRTTGTYRVRGGKMTFKGGGMSKVKAAVEPGTGSRKEPFFNLLVEGRESGVSCYYVRNP